jgi:hypothetical protein
MKLSPEFWKSSSVPTCRFSGTSISARLGACIAASTEKTHKARHNRQTWENKRAAQVGYIFIDWLSRTKPNFHPSSRSQSKLALVKIVFQVNVFAAATVRISFAFVLMRYDLETAVHFNVTVHPTTARASGQDVDVFQERSPHLTLSLVQSLARGSTPRDAVFRPSPRTYGRPAEPFHKTIIGLK